MELPELQVSIFDLMMSLSTAADLISPAVANHGKRVAYIASCLADEIGTPAEEQHDIIIAGAVHDIGALALDERMDLLQFELEEPGTHAEIGYLFLTRSALFSKIADIVRYHHLHWDAAQAQPDKYRDVPYASHILHLADRVDVSTLRHVHPLSQASVVINRINGQRGQMFAPELVDAFVRLAGREYFWLDLSSQQIEKVLENRIRGMRLEVDLLGLVDLAKLFSQLIDFKSSYTSTHSAGVAASAEALAKLVGFAPSECLQMRVAGFLHDLGKLAVSTEILDKQDKLNRAEFDQIRSHTYYTRRILENIPGMQVITDWAAAHHERLDGQGYPFHTSGETLQLGARIMSVADVFTALSEDRPYRAGMPRAVVVAELETMAAQSKLDQTIVELVRTYYDELDHKRQLAQEDARLSYDQLLLAINSRGAHIRSSAESEM